MTETGSAGQPDWRASAGWQESLFETSAIGIAVHDTTRTIRAHNRQLGVLLGDERPDAFVGMHVSELFYPGDEDVAAPLTAQMLAGEIPRYSYDRRFRRRDGSAVWLRVSLAPIPGGEYYFSFSEDITDRRMAELELTRQTLLLERAHGIAGIGTFLIDIERRTIQLSAQLALMLRVGDEEMEMTLAEYRERFYLPERRDDAVAVSERAYESDETELVLEGRLRRADGAIIWVRSVEDRWVENGRQMTLGVSQDVTRQKLAELELRGNAALLARAQEMVGFGSYRVDLARRAIYLSRELARILGAGDVGFELPLDAFNERFYHPDDRARAVAAAERSYSHGERMTIEHRFVRLDGEIRWARVYGEPRQADEGGGLIMVGAVLDITERRRDEEQRQELEERLRQSQKLDAIGQLAGGVAHDFNNILTVINGQAALGVADASSEGRERFEEILEAGERAAVLVRKLLTFSRHQPVDAERIDLNAILLDSERFLRRLIETTIEIVVTVWPAPVLVNVDRVHIDQVLLNLATNARDAMPGGGRLTLSTAIVSRPERREAVLTVSDTGAGMSDDVKERIFEPFFTTKPTHLGTGLGLATVYGIVDAAGGTIAVESAPGRGTAFSITLPLADHGAERGAHLVNARHDHAGNGRRVLLVDDDVQVRPVAEMMLVALGYEVISADTAAAALEIAAADVGLDLLVTDMVMPDLTGRALADRVRLSRPDLPVLFISGYHQESTRELSLARSGYLAKPFTLDGLEQAAAVLLSDP